MHSGQVEERDAFEAAVAERDVQLVRLAEERFGLLELALLLDDQRGVLQHHGGAALVAERPIQRERLLVQFARRLDLTLLVEQSAEAREHLRLAAAVGALAVVAERAPVRLLGRRTLPLPAKDVAHAAAGGGEHARVCGGIARSLEVRERKRPLAVAQAAARGSRAGDELEVHARSGG